MLLVLIVLQVVVAGTGADRTSRVDWSLFNCRLRLYKPCETNEGILYYLYTRKNGYPVVLNGSHVELPEDYNANLPLKIVIHGFAGKILTDPTSDIVKEYMRVGGHNVLAVDWGRLAELPCYPTAAVNTIEVGRCLAQLLYRLSPIHPPDTMHMVGFSLGAHIAAYASNYLTALTGDTVYRITGLDPALPLFATLKDSWKLDRSDALFVDAIHTNVGLFGKIEPTGHVDFYVNDGTIQPACPQHKNPPLCSHMLANTYFAESISSPMGFWGTSCPNYIQYSLGWCPLVSRGQPGAVSRLLMGEHVLYGALGVYIVQTNSSPPFALG